MEKKDFPKGTKPREIFVYTCERIAEPLNPLGYKYRKSKNDIYKKASVMVSTGSPAARARCCGCGLPAFWAWQRSTPRSTLL